MPTQPIDPLTGPRYALEGKVVTMDDDLTVLERGVVYIDAGQIVAVEPTAAPAPPGFEDAPLIRTGGTIFPGLIELHNHLSYNILPMWEVPQQFRRREQWRSNAEKRRLVTGPMAVLGKTPGYVEAIVRYVECKCLVAGVTTSQGLRLYGIGTQPYYRGLMRNVEDTDDPALPEAGSRIPDVEAKDAAKFLSRLDADTCSCLLLHLSEGIDDRSRQHFEALQLPSGQWAITPALGGIHCAALTAEHFRVLEQHGGSMIWSPLSNLLLYGQTADVEAAKEAGVLMGIGSDWSPSGSKNLLGELKVAHLVSESLGGVFTQAEIVAMATTNAAKILKWDKVLGSIEPGKRADLLVVDDRKGDPYERLVEARESSVILVVINGVPRCGQARLMKHFGDGTERIAIGGARRVLNLAQETANPVVGALTLGGAIERLQDGLRRLPELALALEDPSNAIGQLAKMKDIFETPADATAGLIGKGLASGALDLAAAAAGLDLQKPLVFLELDQDDLEGETLRPHLPHGATGEFTGLLEPLAAVSYSELLESVVIELDPLTVVDDERYFRCLARQPNLPDHVKTGLPRFYGVEPWLPEDAIFVEQAHPAVRPRLATTVELSTFLRTGGYLSLDDRKRIVAQALVLLQQIYVHLPLKRAMHAIDPIQRLRLLQYRLEQMSSDDDMSPEIDFHNEMTTIFTSARDLHTNYLLPSPFGQKAAFLPFFVEEYHEDGEPKYLVSKVVGEVGPPSFKEGVEVLYWNGVPIRRAIDLNAERQAGSNLAARHARGLDTLTIRPMVRVLPPDEEWVTIRYRTEEGEELEMSQKWLVFSPGYGFGKIDPDSAVAEATALGFDLQTDAAHQVKKILYAPWAMAAERIAGRADSLSPRGLTTTLPSVFRPKRVETDRGTFGYIRIFTFNVEDADEFVAEFARLAQLLPQNGLIVDVRGNGGGLIYAAERLLQVLTPRHIEPEQAQFINTPLTLEICRRHAPSPLSADFDLRLWIHSIEQAVETGATYSRSFPITLEKSCNTIGQKYFGPVVLITDALCYSATDIFASGFQDHGIGPVLGTSDNMGAGGANVWTHRLLQILMSDLKPPYTPLPNSPFKPLPHGASMRVAVRRTLRVGERAGTPVEDLGIAPDDVHRMTKADLLQGNVDLINRAGEILAGLPTYNLAVEIDQVSKRKVTAMVTTQNVSRLDVYLDGRPLRGSLDVGDGTTPLDLKLPSRLDGELVLELRGYAEDRLVAASRFNLRDAGLEP